MIAPLSLPDQVESELKSVGTVDILVGIPSFNNAGTIGHVVNAATAGLHKYFPDQKVFLVNSDGGSTDGTREIVLKAQLENPNTLIVKHPLRHLARMSTPYSGLPGKGSAFRTIFEIAKRLKAKACCVMDSDLRSVSPEWVELLAGPVLIQGFDYVSPLYARHKYDGTITNMIVYPVTRSLYGKKIRQPIGGDFGFSGAMAEHFLSRDVWETDVARYGVDVWMTTTALTGNFRTCQAFLGAKIHDPKDPGTHLAPMLKQVVGSLFSQMEATFDSWKDVRGSEALPIFGFQWEAGLEPVNINTERMVSQFSLGVQELKGIWEKILSPQTLAEVLALLPAAPGGFAYPDSLWVRTVWDFALAHKKRVLSRDHILGALVPLYLAKTVSFVLETMQLTGKEAEARVEKLALNFEENKSYLTEGWEAKT